MHSLGGVATPLAHFPPDGPRSMIGCCYISYSVYLGSALEIPFFCILLYILFSLHRSRRSSFSRNLYSDICVNVVYFFYNFFSLVFAYFARFFAGRSAAGIRCEKVCF